MSAETVEYVSPEEYLERERSAEFRSEYWDGVIVAMSGGTRRHNRITRNIGDLLGDALEDGNCEVFQFNTKIWVPACNVYFYPDVLVVCEDDGDDMRDDIRSDPVIIVEVVSSSTEASDRGRKFDCYQSLPSVQHYALVRQDAPAIDLYTRQTDGTWELRPIRGADASLDLKALDVTLRLADVYRRVRFQPAPADVA